MKLDGDTLSVVHFTVACVVFWVMVAILTKLWGCCKRNYSFAHDTWRGRDYDERLPQDENELVEM